MSEPQEYQAGPFKATLKAGGGYEAPWVTVEAEDAVDLETKLDTLTEGVLQKLADLASLFRAAHNATLVTTGEVTPQAQTQGTPNNVTQLKTCAHGVRQKKSGTNSRGPWVGYFCPQPRNAADRCEPIYE